MLALDANILVRAVLGTRAVTLIKSYAETVRLLVADTVVAEARGHLPAILAQRDLNPETGLAALEALLGFLAVVERDAYAGQEEEAKRRIGTRDIDDWPTAAVALTFNCGIWTEDRDFFGSGIPTWTTDRVEIFLQSFPPPEE
jgi:predicted nucleic acid-binding protein